MTRPLRCVVLVDDSEADNFLHRMLLEDADVADEIREFIYPRDAMRFLRSPDRPHVNAMLLDINMLGTNGFDYADEFASLYPELREGTKLFILSGSVSPDDRARAEAHSAIAGFLEKPLDPALLLDRIQSA